MSSTETITAPAETTIIPQEAVKAPQELTEVPQDTTETTQGTTKPKKKIDIKYYAQYIEAFVREKPMLSKFYDPTALENLILKAKEMGDKLNDLGCSSEYSVQLSLLTLYDIIMLIDDSGSMTYEEDGARCITLQKTLHEITQVYDLANSTGIKSVKFVNAVQGRKDITNAKVPGVFEGRRYDGGTMIGTAMNKKIIQPFVLKQKMTKPLLVMTITDGEIEGERPGLLKHVIKDCMEKLQSDKDKVEDSVVFHFSRIGNDEGAIALLEHLDDCEEVGKFVDCLPVETPLESIQEESIKWRLLIKLLLGALDGRWDNMKVDIGEDVADIVYGPANPDDNDEDPEDV